MLDEADPDHQNKEKTEIVEAYNRINNELNEMASKYAEAYAKEDDSKNVDQALAVYRMLLLPEDIFRIYLYLIFLFIIIPSFLLHKKIK